RDAARDETRDVVTEAADKALAASEDFRRTLPPAPRLKGREGGRRREAQFEGDVAIRRLRERPSLDPVPVPAPPMTERNSALGVLASVAGAIGLAGLAAFFMVGTAPLSLAVKAEGGGTSPSLWSRLIGSRPQPAPAVVVQPASVRASEAASLAER